MLPRLRAQWPEAFAHGAGERLRLLPRGEVSPLREFLVVDHLRIRLLRPALRGRIDLIGEDRHDHRKLHAPGIEEACRRHLRRVPVEAGGGGKAAGWPPPRGAMTVVAPVRTL